MPPKGASSWTVFSGKGGVIPRLGGLEGTHSFDEGTELGSSDGSSDGSNEGKPELLDSTLGAADGFTLGLDEGTDLGSSDGSSDGSNEGKPDGYLIVS